MAQEMVSKEVLYADSELDLVEKISKNLYDIKPSKFIPFKGSYVYPEPLKSKREINYSFCSRTDYNGFVSGMGFTSQLLLFKEIEDKQGIKLRHGYFKEIFEATFNKKTRSYRDNVLYRHLVSSNELFRRVGEQEYDVRRVVGADFKHGQQFADIILEQNGKLLETEGGKKKLVTIINVGKSIGLFDHSSTGYYNKFSSAIPYGEDFSIKEGQERGHFCMPEINDEGIGASWSVWEPNKDGKGGLLHSNDNPHSHAGATSVISVWSDENPRK